jgi:UDP-2,3-diacylglucosamine pyrophosphatase LpxH
MHTRYIAVADLHLGDGGPCEDFLAWGRRANGPRAGAPRDRARHRLGTRFGAWLQHESLEAHAAGHRAHLLIVGDFVDLWQARRPRESAASAFARILDAHPRVVAALRAWRGAGHALTWILGNHDGAMADAKAWALAREVLPGLNDSGDGGPVGVFHGPEAGLVAVHGHQWDPMNRARRGASPGELLVRHVIIHAEPHAPLIDKGRTVLDAAWAVADLAAAPVPLGHARLQRWWDRVAMLPPERRAALEARRSARIAAEVDAHRRGLEADAGRPVRILLSGHEHRAQRTDFPGGTHLRLGTWRPIAERGARGRWRIEQHGHIARIYPAPGGHRAELAVW